jgi:hypothetical protein
MVYVVGILLGLGIIWAVLYVLNWLFGDNWFKKDLLIIQLIFQIIFLPISILFAIIVFILKPLDDE